MAKVWTVVGIGTGSQLHVANILAGNVADQLLVSPGLAQDGYTGTPWAHVVRAKDPQAAKVWAEESYRDHVAGHLDDAQVTITVSAPKRRFLRRKGTRH